ncbi:hypothetical protein JCM10295v2_005741 [Rhodotorula toruloides]
MTLDSRPRSIDAVTRVCYARGLPSSNWLSLVREVAQTQGLAQDEVEKEVTALETIRYLSYFLSHLPHRLTKATVNSALLEACAKRVQVAVHEVARAGPTDAPVLAKLRQDLEALGRKLIPKSWRRVPSRVDLDEVDETEGLRNPYGDVALLVSRVLSDPFLPTQQLRSSLLALIRYRTAQSAFRKSTPQKALVLLLSEVLGGLLHTLQEPKRADVVLESLLFAKVPGVLKDVTTVDNLDKLPEALAQALRLVPGRLAKAGSVGGMDVDRSASSLSNQFVVACCQVHLLLPDVGASLAREVDVGELQPVMIEDYQHRLATGSIDDFKQVLDEAVHSYAPQQGIASAISSLFAAKAQSADLAGLTDLCDVLAENKDAMSVVFLHIEPRELLRPVRHVLDSFDTSQENSDDINPIERYGSLVLFVQLAADRFKLLDNLAYHLDSSTSFITSWLRSASAVYAISTMSDDERNVVSGWIGALFGEGISDDLMHATNPRTLLRVAPTILKQSLKARQTGIVDMDSLRDALSYFLQELLRFTLPGVLKWLIAEIEQTTAMLDLLQVLVFSDALPSAVLELVALDLARLLLDPAFTSNAPPTVDIARLRKTIAPYRPPAPSIQPASVDEPAAFDAAVQQVLGPHQPASDDDGAAATLTSLHDSLRLCLRASRKSAHFFVDTFLPQLFSSPQDISPAVYSRLERYAAAILAAPNSTQRRPLVVELLWNLDPPNLAEWDRRSLPAVTTDGLVAGENDRMQAELLGDAVAGAVLLVKGEAEADAATSSSWKHVSAALYELARRVEAVRRGRKKSDDHAREDEERSTMLDTFFDRLLSWPVVVEASPRLSALTAN